MLLKPWNELPEIMRTEQVRPYYDVLRKHTVSLFLKRAFDLSVSFLMLLVLWPVMLVIAVAIRVDSPGFAIFRQERVTRYGKRYKIWKFRTMVENAQQIGTQVTMCNDARITKLGRFLRRTRLDELPQLVNIITGDMSYVGTRPEVAKYVECYHPEYYATLLMPAGVTSEASIRYKDENQLLKDAENVDEVYVNVVLPEKMKYNLLEIRQFNIFRELLTTIRTILAILRKEQR